MYLAEYLVSDLMIRSKFLAEIMNVINLKISLRVITIRSFFSKDDLI